MSVESAKACFERITSDEDFRNQLDRAVTPEDRQQVILKAGYQFTEEEWNEMIAPIRDASSNEELSIEELESVVGGLSMMYGGSPIYMNDSWWNAIWGDMRIVRRAEQ